MEDSAQMIFGRKLIVHNPEKAKPFLSESQTRSDGYERVIRYFIKQMIEGVDAQQIEFDDGVLNQFQCKICGKTLNKITTSSKIFGDFSVYPRQCEPCKIADYKKNLEDEEIKMYLSRSTRCGKYQNKITKHCSKNVYWENLDDKYQFQQEFLNYLVNVLDGDNSSAFVYGPPGTGKSFMCKMLVNELIKKRKDVAFIKAVDMAMLLRRTSISKNNDFGTLMKQLRNVPTLIVDDFGTQKDTDFIRESIFSIFDYRYDNRKQTIVTTNLKFNDLSDERLASRVQDVDWMKLFCLNFKDLRYGARGARGAL